MVQKLEMGYCPLSMRLGAGLGRRGRRRACRACWRWAQASGTAWANGALAGARARGRAIGRMGVGSSDARGERGHAAGAGRGARGGRLGGLCDSGVRNWARLGVLVHLTQFLAWFDSVFS